TVFNRRYLTRLGQTPALEAMRRAEAVLQGEHDFRSFCGNPKMKKSTVRTVDTIEIVRKGGYLYFNVHGTGFLQNMVRILVGTLLEVGYGRISPEQMEAILEAKDRRQAGPTAPPEGLCLMKVDY
ncbi:MAG: tRNA pseudouridine(38-40) synthase TruA, partial [Clostridiales bacterium]|nr:tRNA pseudouridine(38-40) synthase TruA [Clostridiales bacterium]